MDQLQNTGTAEIDALRQEMIDIALAITILGAEDTALVAMNGDITTLKGLILLLVSLLVLLLKGFYQRLSVLVMLHC